MADQQEILNTILLTRLNYFSLAGMLELYRRTGSATLIMEHRNDIRSLLPDASDKLVNALKNCDEARKRAEVELEYDIRYGIEPITMNDDRYPQRLKDCDDAPLMLFYKGNANLNQQRVINIIGTRHCTPYGEDLHSPLHLRPEAALPSCAHRERLSLWRRHHGASTGARLRLRNRGRTGSLACMTSSPPTQGYGSENDRARRIAHRIPYPDKRR